MRRTRLLLLATVTFALLAVAHIGKAEVIFVCGYTDPTWECAFTAWTVDANSKDTGATSFVIAAGKEHGLPDSWKGGWYCMNGGKPHQPVPVRPNCDHKFRIGPRNG